jgi:hypothetical protein
LFLSDIARSAAISTMMDKKEITPNRRNNMVEREGEGPKTRKYRKTPQGILPDPA